MSKRNRENRARKQAKRAKPKAPSLEDVFVGNSARAVRARRRFGIMMPFFWLADRTPFVPGMELQPGSIIVRRQKGADGLIPGGVVPRAIAEVQRELGVSFQEIIDVLVDAEASGLLVITDLPTEPAAP
jgi:hypothetical protein